MTKDYLIEVRVKNNLLLKKIHERGFSSVAEFSRAAGIHQTVVARYVGLKDPALNRWGRWRKSVELMAKALRCLPEDLFPPQHIDKALKRSKASFEANVSEVATFLSGGEATARTALEHITATEAQGQIQKTLLDLSAREERIIRLRYGFEYPEELTYQAIGEMFGVQRERIRQIEAKALRKLKHPKRSSILREAAEGLGMTIRRSNKAVNRQYVPQWKLEEEQWKSAVFKKACELYGVRAIFEPDQVFEEMKAKGEIP